MIPKIELGFETIHHGTAENGIPAAASGVDTACEVPCEACFDPGPPCEVCFEAPGQLEKPTEEQIPILTLG